MEKCCGCGGSASGGSTDTGGTDAICETDGDCNSNGVCSPSPDAPELSICLCDDGWSGSFCQYSDSTEVYCNYDFYCAEELGDEYKCVNNICEIPPQTTRDPNDCSLEPLYCLDSSKEELEYVCDSDGWAACYECRCSCASVDLGPDHWGSACDEYAEDTDDDGTADSGDSADQGSTEDIRVPVCYDQDSKDWSKCSDQELESYEESLPVNVNV
eukprot:UN28056